MKMRKAVSVLLAAGMAASLFTGAIPAAADDATPLTLWTYPVGSWGDSETVDALLASFNEVYPDISVTVEYLDYTNGDDQINTAIEGGQAPDLVLEGPERLVANWGAKGYMADLAELFEEDAAKDFYETVNAACRNEAGNYYEYPLCMVAHCMAINRDVFEAADALKYLDEEAHTWNSTSDFLKAIEAVRENGQDTVMAVYCSGQGGDQGTRALINNMYGGSFTNPEHTAYTADDEENVKALTELQALIGNGVNFDASIAGGDEINLFRQGQLAVSLCWNASQQNNADNGEAGKTNDGSVILPMMFPTEGNDEKLCGGIWGFGVFDNGDEAKIEAAKSFIRYMANENALEAVKTSGFFPAHSELTGVYDGTDTADTMTMFQEKFMPHMGDYYQVVPGWATARTEWWNMLQRVGTGGDPAAELTAFVEAANAAAAGA